MLKSGVFHFLRSDFRMDEDFEMAKVIVRAEQLPIPLAMDIFPGLPSRGASHTSVIQETEFRDQWFGKLESFNSRRRKCIYKTS